MPSQQYQPSVRSVGSGISEVQGASHKAWSVDLEKGGTRAEGEAEKGIDGISLDPYPNLDYINPMEEPASYVNMQVNDAPEGYPMLARFISSHEDGYIFREFRYLQSRTLLHMQDELRALELQLHRMDLHDARNRAIFLKTREMDDDRLKVRGRLMEEIAEKLKTYGELLIMSNNLANFDRPSRFDIQSLENFFRAKEPLFRHERYIGCQSDMITLKAGRDDAWLDRVIMQLLVKYNCAPLRYIFANAHTKTHADSKHEALNLFSIARVHFLKMVILIFLMLCLLCLPLVPLYSWTQEGSGPADGGTDSASVTGQMLAKIMGLIVACAFAFGVVLSVCTRAKKHEIFGSCAAYMAVLIVFMTST